MKLITGIKNRKRKYSSHYIEFFCGKPLIYEEN